MDQPNSESIGKSNRIQGHFMYADYSPLEDDRNLIDIIRDFATLVSKLGKTEISSNKLGSLLTDSDSLRESIIAAIKGIQSNTTTTIDKFYNEHSDVLASDLLTSGSALLLDTKNSLSQLLGTTATSFDQKHSSYKEGVLSRKEENNHTASNLIKTWLADDIWNLPRPIVSNLVVTIIASIDPKHSPKTYSIIRTTTATTATAEMAPAKIDKAEKGGSNDLTALQFSYTFSIDGSDMEFWNHRKTVAELGIKDLMLPIGMKAHVSEKIKQSFRFGSRKDAEISKEPEFLKVDDYHLRKVELQGNKTLTVDLAREPSSAEHDLFRITYDISGVPDLPIQYAQQQQPGVASSRPKIDFISTDKGTTMTDLLQIGEIEKNSDISKIQLLGAAVLTRLRTLQAPEIVRSRGTLEELRTHDNVVIIPSAIQKGDFSALFEFLESVSYSFAPFIRTMKEKTTLPGELTIREELGSGQRKEFSVRIDDLKSKLSDMRYGSRVVAAMGL